MRRLLWLAVVFVVFSTCAPSYGYFLIYNVSCSVKGANNNLAATIPLKGYLVANLDSAGDLVDANLIMYGQDHLKNKVYVQLNHAGSNSTLNVKMKILYNGNLMGVDIWDYNDSPFYFEVFVIGKLVPKNIGSSTKDVASSLNGPISVWGGILLDPTDDIMGTGNVSASLDLKTTNLVNANGWTQENIVETGGDIAGKHQNSFIQKLAAQHFQAAVLPE
jgi:hypothetical protein